MKLKTIFAALGGFALQFLLSVVIILLVGVCLWVVVPVAFPALGFTFTNSVGLSGLLFLARGVFK